MKDKLPWIGIVALNTILFLLSLYLVWGWVTVGDIHTKCEKQGVDFDQVMESLISNGPNINEEQKTNGTLAVNLSWTPSKFPAFRRYALSFAKNEIVISNSTTNSVAGGNYHLESVYSFDGGLIEPFAALSENVVNFLFACGLGYLMSCAILLVKALRKNSMTVGYVLLRPIAGGLVAGCLFLVILAGGRVFWEKASPVNGPSVGLLAAFAAVYCERFERWLKTQFADKK